MGVSGAIIYSTQIKNYLCFMYVPKEFKEKDQQELLGFLRLNPLGTIVSTTGTPEPMASHIPLMAKVENEEIWLEGHLALVNPQAELLKEGKTVLVIFQGPDAYISASVYGHVNVPTWNYQSVHMYGIVEQMTTPELIRHLDESVDYFESQRHQKLTFADFPEKMIEAMVTAIAGVRIRVYKTEAAYKMSQNRNDKDYENIIADLAGSESLKDKEVAAAMKVIYSHKKR